MQIFAYYPSEHHKPEACYYRQKYRHRKAKGNQLRGKIASVIYQTVKSVESLFHSIYHSGKGNESEYSGSDNDDGAPRRAREHIQKQIRNLMGQSRNHSEHNVRIVQAYGRHNGKYENNHRKKRREQIEAYFCRKSSEIAVKDF